MICAACTPGNCVERNPAYPFEIECPLCDATGCDHCNGSGRFDVEGCPKRYLTTADVNAIRLAEFAEKGMLPATGTIADQEYHFVELCEAWWYERNNANAERQRMEWNKQ